MRETSDFYQIISCGELVVGTTISQLNVSSSEGQSGIVLGSAFGAGKVPKYRNIVSACGERPLHRPHE